MQKIINAFFSGTGFDITDRRFLAARLYDASKTSNKQHCFGFNGCGVDYGTNGMLWGTGLDKQCQEVIAKVRQEIEAGNTVKLNVYGHSRGAIGALLLAKQLAKVDPNVLDVNLALLDPVPGNFITTSSSDFLNISLANKTMDLSDCGSLKNVLALYPYEPLPDIACHAPLFPVYPSHTNVNEEVIPGCHAQAEQTVSGGGAARIAYIKNYQFLNALGTLFDKSALNQDLFVQGELKDVDIEQELKQLYGRACIEVEQATYRPTHSNEGKHITCAPVLNDDGVRYFNKEHQQLMNGGDDATQRLVNIKTSSGLLSTLKETLRRYPQTTNMIKWGLISLGLTATLLTTGGFAIIPGLALLTSSIGLASSFALTASVLGASSALTWSYMVKPALLWSAAKFYYPHFEMADIQGARPISGSDNESSRVMLEGLGIEPTTDLKQDLVFDSDKLAVNATPTPTQRYMIDFLQTGSTDEVVVGELKEDVAGYSI